MSSTPLINNQPNVQPEEHGSKFLFCIEPKELAYECCCGCSLKTGVQIISFLFVIGRIGNFSESIRHDGTLAVIYAMILLLVSLIGAISLIYSTISLEYKYAWIGYMIYAVFFVLNIVEMCFVVLVILFNVLVNGVFYTLVYAVAFLLVASIFLSLSLYFVWIVFSYAVHLKARKISLISGDNEAKRQYMEMISLKNRNNVA